VKRPRVRGAASVAALIALAMHPLSAAAGTNPKTSRCTLDKVRSTTIDRRPFLSNALGMRWNAATNRLVFTQAVATGYYHVFTMGPDGSDRRAVTDGLPAVPARHQGSPYWHPSGHYLIFVAQKPDWSGRSIFGVPDYEALPGFGRHDDLWLIAADGKRGWQLTNDPNTKDQGILIPVFSPDGKRVAWSSRQPGGTYVLKVADFVETPQPHLQRIVSYRPGGASYYETGSFVSNSQSMVYTSDQDTHSFWHSQIYRLDLATGKSTRLTPGNDYNEHPTVVKTPGGDRVVYMSTKGVDRFPGHLLLGTDWYVMKPDGSDARRLTTMNVNRAGNPENIGAMQVAGTVAVNPAGGFMLGDVQDSLVKQTGAVKVVRFSCGDGGN
jgi:Tol biopolymer transport system component